MIIEGISCDEAISRNLSPDRLYCGVMCDCTITNYKRFFIYGGHNITLKIVHDLKYRPVLFSSTLHFEGALN